MTDVDDWKRRRPGERLIDWHRRVEERKTFQEMAALLEKRRRDEESAPALSEG